MMRSQREVERVARGVRGHEAITDVSGDDLGHGLGDVEDRQPGDQCQGGFPARIVTLAQLVEDRVARDQLVPIESEPPPEPRPLAANEDRRSRTGRMVEARNRGLDLDAGLEHVLLVIACSSHSHSTLEGLSVACRCVMAVPELAGLASARPRSPVVSAKG